MRQIVLDTETTGLEWKKGNRVVEIGCVELVERRPTGRTWQQYIHPEREFEPGAQEVTGLTLEFLADKPKFAEIADAFLDFIDGAELIIHNAAFDIAFLDAELGRLGGEPRRMAQWCTVLDTLALARRMHPGQRNSLDALCKRYSVDNSHRDFHGALLDARILADVYLAMTGGQAMLTLSAESDSVTSSARKRRATAQEGARIAVVQADAAEIEAHERVLQALDKASRGRTVWRM